MFSKMLNIFLGATADKKLESSLLEKALETVFSEYIAMPQGVHSSSSGRVFMEKLIPLKDILTTKSFQNIEFLHIVQSRSKS